jgi:hypothetical protein
MGIRGIWRGPVVGQATATNAPLRVDPADNKLKFIPAGTGTTEQVVGNSYPPALLAADGAIPIVTGAYVITKGSAAALTLAAPTAAQAGTRLTVMAGTAFAHVITATGLLDDGITGGSKTTATFGAFVGASIELLAYNLKWIVVSKNVVTIT